MAEWHLKVLEKARTLWPKESKETNLLELALARKTAELAIMRGKQALGSGDVNSALVHFTEAKRRHKSASISAAILLLRVAPRLVGCWRYYRRARISALIILLRVAPGLVRFVFRLRGMLLPHPNDSMIS
jgi:hypothetical protein